MAIPVADSYTFTTGQPVNAGRFGVGFSGSSPISDLNPSGSFSISGGSLGFDSSFERSSFNPTGSSLTPGAGTAGSILAKINPKPATDQTNGFMWMNASVDITGMNGEQPTFQFLQAGAHNFGGVWPVGRCCMYSYDNGESWNYFSSAGIKDAGNDWVQWRHNTAFTQDRVRISESRAMSVHSHGTRIASLAATYSFVEPAPSAVAYTPTGSVSGYAAQIFIANEFPTAVDVLGNTIPITPFYAFQINDTSLVPVSGSKKLWLINGGTHSGEDMGDFSMWYGLNWLCGNSAEAIQLRRDFRIVVYPCTTARGRAAGYGRGDVSGTSNDVNRNFDNLSSMLAVTFCRNANTTDFAGAALRVFLDYHGTYSGKWEASVNNAVDSDFLAKLRTLTGFSITDIGALATNRKSGFYHSAASDGFSGAALSTTLEHGDPTPTTEADLILFGESVMRVVYQMNQEGDFA